jgi:2-polyprenyl-3-methyl-5-hydroxy-6-metoxy-1,4-benzoquinol methylase
MIFSKKRFVEPISVAQESDKYDDIGSTYTDANYGEGIAGYLRKRHFEAALELTEKYFHSANVIDYGCSDGPFLPSLSKYFNNITGIEINLEKINIAFRLIQKMNLLNIRLILIENIQYSQPIVQMDFIKSKLEGRNYKIIFLLEALEHIGDKDNLYVSQINFLKDLFRIIDEDGIIVISVPKMFGLAYFFQIIGLRLLGQHPEHSCHSIKTLIKASFWIDTDNVEKLWCGGHEGYNYKKLEKILNNNFYILSMKDIVFQKVYLIKNRE